ncbi:branched-chain amino acid ABC transporter permease [Modestobacter muralis]|uniref:Branched-chain amino acid ABC transporter permease n=1 Tax=Modestobacter muralis TaxID=1608614 RepID=A0A6P0H8B4_9ACTN|nr:branched-chain amino acid ABC transporter permease [Modestobacter muralis]NEK95240.1 branched-chain amino acid ABC transporter permease [Modestobacter muralis]NEN52128.1 branched-chain amino acid ABC transporter permease [Modestobacter muralis]
MTSDLGTSSRTDQAARPDTGPARGRAGRAPRLVLAAALLLALVAVPFVVPSDAANLLSRILAFALLAVSLDLLVGVGGMPSLGHAAPFGVGAYVAGITAKELTALAPVQLVAAAVAGAVFSALVGWLIVRVRGTYFLMLTLAVAELARTAADQWDQVTGGSNGLVGIPAIQVVPGGGPLLLAGFRYWYVLAVAALGFGLIVAISRSAFGRSLRGIRDNEDRMASLGYSTFRVKFTAFVLAGAFAGAAGSLWTVQSRFVSPADLGFNVSAMALLAVVIGGRGRLWGAILGAALVIFIRDEVGAQLGGRGPLLLGITFIAVVYLLPRGFAGLRLHRPGRKDPA